MIKSCYIHIPFCNNICSYCDFCKNYYNEKIVLRYLDYLKQEINNNYKKEVLDTLYIGGGTPSSLSKYALNNFFDILSCFKLNNNYEFTFECNYEDITEDLLKLLKKNKVNRISIGIQTFNEKFKHFLNRNINKNKMIKSINLTKKYFDNINVDLMYAISNQTIKDLEEDLKVLISLDINHISTYCLIIEEHTNLRIRNTKEIDEDLQSIMYYKIIDVLKKEGFNHYEISNFSKKNCEAKHNLTYWTNQEYYGFGAGASGFVNNIRYDNTKSVFNYIKGNVRIYEEKLDIKQKMKDEVMLLLRTTKGINKKEFNRKYNININDLIIIKELINEGYLKETNKYIYITEKYLFISNYIILKILDTL